MKISKIAEVINADFSGKDIDSTGFSTDTRTLKAGDVFIALQGPTFDGHDFIKDVEDKKAVAVIVSKDVKTTLPVLRVKDTLAALSGIAAYYRDQVDVPVIAVTGSYGKTTTKSMLASIFKRMGPTLAPEGSFNNHIGLPLTLLKLGPEHQYVVLELGANHVGEIENLTKIAKPTIAAVTTVGPAHLEGFGSIENIAKAKGEIFSHLSEEGVAILNRDDEYFEYFKSLITHKHQKIITFSTKSSADIYAKHITLDQNLHPVFDLVTPEGVAHITLKLLGKHSVLNALVAAAAAHVAGVSLHDIKEGLETLQPVSKRLCVYKGIHGVRLIDDTYNANLDSTKAALDILSHCSGKRIFAFADMKELGEQEVVHHKQVGNAARESGVHELYAYGDLARHAVQAFGQKGRHFDTQEEMIQAIKNSVDDKTSVLAKGSNSMKMWEVIEALK